LPAFDLNGSPKNQILKLFNFHSLVGGAGLLRLFVGRRNLGEPAPTKSLFFAIFPRMKQPCRVWGADTQDADVGMHARCRREYARKMQTWVRTQDADVGTHARCRRGYARKMRALLFFSLKADKVEIYDNFHLSLREFP
jgi:hypothetical protein